MFLVGEVDGRLVATDAVRPVQGYIAEYIDVDDGTAEVARMRVAPDHQGRGYGRRVYEAPSSGRSTGESGPSCSTRCRA